jgi:serine/threonine protein kinase
MVKKFYASGMGESRLAVSSAGPERFGKYEVIRHLASGGMADVYLARATGIQGFEKIVVCKRIRPDLVGDPAVTQLFLHEARLAATLEHPHIAQVYDVGIAGDNYFFAMEYVHGADLRDLLRIAHIRKIPVPLPDALHVMVGVCAALHYAHEKRSFDGEPVDLVHRDVSPSNVLLSYDGAVKVCDFGIAKANTPSRKPETARGTLKGKLSYMSPEQCRMETLDRRSDIFSIGVVLYELTTLTKLFRAPSDFELMKRIVEHPIAPPSRIRPGYPAEIERIVMKALEKDPAARYATAQEMQLELEAFAREQKLALSSVSLARLMSQLFDNRISAWQQAQRGGKRLGDHLKEKTPGVEGDTEFDAEIIPRTQPSPPRHKHANLALRLAAVTAVVGLGASAVGWRENAGERETTRTLATLAESLGATLDSEARALHLRAESIAVMPMLRAAIETDAKTLGDMAKKEFVFSPKAGEVLELFQLRQGRAASLMRIPAGAPPIQPIQGTTTRLEPDKNGLRIIASAAILPLYKSQGVDGALALASRVDLEPARRRLAQLVSRASLQGLAQPIALVDGTGEGPRARSVVPVSPEHNLPPLALEASLPRLRFGWTTPLRNLSALFTLALLFIYLFGRRPARS